MVLALLQDSWRSYTWIAVMSSTPAFVRGSRRTSRKGRAGDILGLADAVVPKSPEDPFPAHDPESAARRRERIRSGDEEGAFSRTPEQTRATA